MTDYIVYLLINTCCNNTYIGMTNNKIRRLRQHNGELVGGAKYTTSKAMSTSHAPLKLQKINLLNIYF